MQACCSLTLDYFYIFRAALCISLLLFSHVIWAQEDRLPTNQAYLFSADAETLLGNQPLRTTFSCQGREYGYYADVANNCQVRK